MAKAKKTVPKKAAKAGKAAKAKPAVKAAGKVKIKKVQPKAVAKKSAKPVMKTKAPVKSKKATKVSAKAISKSAKKTTTPRAATIAGNDKKSESYFKSYLKPLDDRIVVLVGANERVTAGGLFIPDTVTDVSGNFQGKVMAIGRGHMNKKGRVRPLDVSVGDKIVFSQFSGSQIDVDGNNIMIIRESDVLGIVK